MLGVSIARNKNLANIFYRLKLIEAYGTGIMKINNAYTDYSHKPKIEISDNAFKITMPNTNYLQEHQQQIEIPCPTNVISKNEAAVLTLIKQKKYIVRKDIEEHLKISQSTAILLLKRMQKNKLITKVGVGTKTRYVLGLTK